MDTLEGLVIKKKVYGESDYILTIFTREAGKISGIAKNAKKSKKRFGGRLEPFLLLRIFARSKNTGLMNITDVELIKAYKNIYDDIDAFLVSSFVLEHLDILAPEKEPIQPLFDLTLKTLEELNKKKTVLPALLEFQIEALTICGYEPAVGEGFKMNNDSGKSVFSLNDGGITDRQSRIDNANVFEFFNDIIVNPETMEIFLSKVANNIKVLARYTEYHTGRTFKTSKFLEDLKI